ncbi:HSP20-like chaperone [Mytilinidion resinicola]|uniref:HSP20-like chaperone n=1 Tax=Mytilinidion resinicola TaxID=574789 RepID=A0A6A6Z5P5_9PEZI|nr:HSP20-like chaperone [Mytilinidion resinicola]KAF2815614.1 HSP20-like chaperone [Mytilinidion resinicola]
MPSIRYVNQSAPFWDFVANLEQQGQAHPFFAAQQGREAGEERETSGDEQPFGPWGHPWARRGGPRGPYRHRGPPPPPEAPAQPEGPPAPYTPGEGPSDAPQPPHHEHPDHEHPRHEGPPHHRGCGGRRGRGFGGRGGIGGFGGPWMGGPFNLASLATQLFGQDNEGETKDASSDDFKPEADVFDTESAFVIHVSLPGAKKEDVGVNWDAEKSEVSIAGVIYRPGDEEFLKTLALDERKIGAFERKVRLGSRANPAQVDADMITAKLEDGILRVEVPKQDRDYVEIKKVDIE